MEQRIEAGFLQERVVSTEMAASAIQNGMTVAFGGYTSSGYPKAIAKELVKRKQRGETLSLRVLSGANNGPLDTMLAGEEIISWRAPMLESKALAVQVNKGDVLYAEQQMNKMPRLVRDGAFGEIQVAVVEALRITKEGYIVPTSSIGMVPYFLEMAKTVIVEINMAQPLTLDGMHDVYMPELSPVRKPIPLTQTNEKIGTPFMKVNPDKIQYIVFSDIPDETPTLAPSKGETVSIAENLIRFLEEEQKKMPMGILPPLQTGFGNLASEIVKGLERSTLQDISFFCGGLQEANMELIAKGRVKAASTGSIQMTPRVKALLAEKAELFQRVITLRNTDITNQGETIGRFGVIALTSGIEIDIYGNVNSSHIGGTKIVNGLGGGANFAQNAGLSILLIQSESKGGDISAIVPMVSHQDISEHDIDVVITENGIADIRGLDDRERAEAIIQNCAGIHYRDALWEYFQKAKLQSGGHHPQLLSEAFSWHIRLKETGSMGPFI